MKRFVPSLSDFSGQNWDDMALTLLIDQIGQFDSINPSLHEGPRDVSRTDLNQPMKNVYVLNAGFSSREPTLVETTVTSEKVDLSQTDLQKADLSHANLKGVNLSRANLFAARLDRANLEQADLRGADLRSARLAAAKLKDTRLYGAIFDQWTSLPFDKETALGKGMIYLEISAEQ